MAYQLLYFDEVLTDVQEAKAWHKEKRDGLEDEFALAVETAPVFRAGTPKRSIDLK